MMGISFLMDGIFVGLQTDFADPIDTHFYVFD
jgi:hypothetical protein